MGESILVVDDDPAIGEAMASALGRRYQVRVACTGAEAIGAICETTFDLIFLDHRLPDLLGTDLLKLIKRFFPATMVVMITGQGSEEVAIAALQGGARDYLRKPFSLPDLEARVHSLLTLRREGRERRQDPYLDFPAPATGNPDPDADRSRSVFRAIQYVESHLDARHTLDTVARIAGMSKSHFCRRFKAVTGLPFRVFLTQKRMARAKALLRGEGMRVGDVARAVGFGDPTHFGRVFRKLERLLPSEFRRSPRSHPLAGETGHTTQ